MKLGLYGCVVCGTRWLLWPDSPSEAAFWNLLDRGQRPGACCDNAPMGEQLEHLRDLLMSPAETLDKIAALKAWLEKQDSLIHVTDVHDEVERLGL